MTVLIPSGTELWEALCVITLAQKFNWAIHSSSEHLALFGHAGLPINSEPWDDANFGAAYRAAESSQESYLQALAKTFYVKISDEAEPRFPDIQAGTSGGILLAPFGLKKELDLPVTVWRSVARHLRTHGPRVSLIGPTNQRMDEGSFTEAEILSNYCLGQKLQALAQAQLIVGVPNFETLAATAWQKPMVLLYPDHVPGQRWFWTPRPEYGRMVYTAHQVQIPIILSGLRKLVAVL